MKDARPRKFLVLITARGGSKGIPRKNIRRLNGKPLIAYTIEAAKRSKYRKYADLICSTDDRAIAGVARRWGCEVPFMRPRTLATGKAASLAVAQHALRFMEKTRGLRYSYLVLLQPTSPLRTQRHLDEAIALILKRRCDSVVSVVQPNQLPYMLKRLDRRGFLKAFLRKGKAYPRRQDFSGVVALNGAIYITQRDVLIKKNRFLGDKTLPYLMDRRSSVDIDTLEDFEIAALFMKVRTVKAREKKS